MTEPATHAVTLPPASPNGAAPQAPAATPATPTQAAPPARTPRRGMLGSRIGAAHAALIAGTARITQLRMSMRRNRRAPRAE
jgi:hypothetical protein